MTIHSIQLQCDANADAALVQPTTGFIAVWLTNFTAWTDPSQTNENVSIRNTALDGSGTDYYAAPLWRFEWTEDKALLLDNLEGHVGPRTTWYRLRYHVCYHDEDSPTGCQWDEVREGGTVPPEIP